MQQLCSKFGDMLMYRTPVWLLWCIVLLFGFLMFYAGWPIFMMAIDEATNMDRTRMAEDIDFWRYPVSVMAAIPLCIAAYALAQQDRDGD